MRCAAAPNLEPLQVPDLDFSGNKSGAIIHCLVDIVNKRDKSANRQRRKAVIIQTGVGGDSPIWVQCVTISQESCHTRPGLTEDGMPGVAAK